GRTPPCVQRIVESGIAKVVVGMKDPNPLMDGNSVALLRRVGLQVEVGYLTKELEKLNEVFIKYIRKKIPFVTAKIAQTLDGKIATVTGESQWITSESTRAFSRRRRDEFDAIMVGANTVMSDDPGLSPFHQNKRLRKVIVDSVLKISPDAQLFKHVEPADVILATTRKASASKIKAFLKQGVTVLVAPLLDPSGRVPLQWLMRELGAMQIASVLIEGGGRLIGSALKEGVVDKMSVYIAPKIMGGQNAVSGVSGLNIKNVSDLIELEDTTLTPLKEDFLLEGYVHRNH
ncbi:MAG: bifunctional diaminohydroxyphosphoribosylaminopyrimidine deaminase/5-amino-6-(5-phosphoribosylamino)uracil reductase RibD, partial [Candidatus Omnitrophica bacterium]|nr:bifunctional diaminohydroxyphosphoribosylaminopyrimidine deaminase/5-amino-6-(5-phosphoribosylamino)uracil reductase RibD [Candidatus Omnitrophota bacterium]